jgi:hypothetical protein
MRSSHSLQPSILVEREEIAPPEAIVAGESAIHGEELLHRLEGARAELGEDGVIVDVRVLGNKIGADLDVFTIGQELLMG